jgi:hypothetical protein
MNDKLDASSVPRPLRILYVAKLAPVDLTTSIVYFALPNSVNKLSQMVLACPRPKEGKRIAFEKDLAGLHYYRAGLKRLPLVAKELAR